MPDGRALARRAYSVAAMRELARRALPRPVFDFADGGAEDERTLRRNESALSAQSNCCRVRSTAPASATCRSSSSAAACRCP